MTKDDVQKTVDLFNAAWGAHDLAAALQMLTETAIFDATGPAPDGTRFVGRVAIAAAWKPIFEDVTATFEIEDALVSEDRMVQMWRYQWTDGHVRGVDIIRVENGLIAEKFSYVKG